MHSVPATPMQLTATVGRGLLAAVRGEIERRGERVRGFYDAGSFLTFYRAAMLRHFRAETTEFLCGLAARPSLESTEPEGLAPEGVRVLEVGRDQASRAVTAIGSDSSDGASDAR